MQIKSQEGYLYFDVANRAFVSCLLGLISLFSAGRLHFLVAQPQAGLICECIAYFVASCSPATCVYTCLSSRSLPLPLSFSHSISVSFFGVIQPECPALNELFLVTYLAFAANAFGLEFLINAKCKIARISFAVLFHLLHRLLFSL